MSSLAPNRIFFVALALIIPGNLTANPAPKKTTPSTAPAATPSTKGKATPPASAPRKGKGLAGLKVVIAKEKLPVQRSIRPRQTAARGKAKGTIKLQIRTIPSGAKVIHGKKTLGVTPLTLEAAAMSTPLDLVLKRGGSMTLRTRVFRQIDRSYTFRLSPAKLR